MTWTIMPLTAAVGLSLGCLAAGLAVLWAPAFHAATPDGPTPTRRSSPTAGGACKEAWARAWVDEVYRTALAHRGVRYLCAVRGPATVDYAGREIGNAALATLLARPPARPGHRGGAFQREFRGARVVCGPRGDGRARRGPARAHGVLRSGWGRVGADAGPSSTSCVGPTSSMRMTAPPAPAPPTPPR